MKEMENMKINHGLHGLGSLTFAVMGMLWGGVAVAATGTSAEFKVDLKGMGPWEMRTAAASEAIAYSSAWATNALSGANAVVKVYPAKREKPKYIAIDLSGGTTATHYPIEYLDEIPGGAWSDEYKTSKLVLRHIPAGSFIMGGRNTDYPGAVNTNLHMVTLTKDFYMGVFEVTQRQWELVMGNRPSFFTNETCYATRPVDCVSYQDIRGGDKGLLWPKSKGVDGESFIEIIRRKAGVVSLDLPTEAQWEYACRANTTSALNNGLNIADTETAGELRTLARYIANSNYGSMTIDEQKACSDECCSAKVGSYQPNAWGLYDMHGNLWEWTLDCIGNGSESIDPVGPVSGTQRQRKGGTFTSGSTMCVSSSRSKTGIITLQERFTGFRLCFHGGEIPELDESAVLVNAAGEGTANWTPTKAGTYYLTHETQTNGVNGAELLGAWFTVSGPELTFSPDGELTPGVKVAIGGAGEGWTIHYEVGGQAGTLAPTSESPEYTGPITLNESATIRAIAYSDGGVASEEFSATYSLMSVVNAVAKPRYPWNGKVDIDCEVKGDVGRQYAISLEARDLDGGTNLPVCTVVGRAVPGEPQSQTNEFAFVGDSGGVGHAALPPGTYRFTWDADADIAGDGEFPNVAVSVKAEGGATVGAKNVLEMTVDGYTGTETLTNVPVLVRLSTAISGFDYDDFADTNGGDLIFCDESESVIYPHEIDEWHTNGESLVWVKLPTMANGTKFKAAWGNYQLSTTNYQLSPKEVWRDYAGVWHMNEDSGVAYDSTAHGLDAIPSCGTNTLADISQMVAYENGACGRARVNATERVYSGNRMEVPSYDALELGGSFIISIWANLDDFGTDPLLMRNANRIVNGYGYHFAKGWCVEIRNTDRSVIVDGGTNHTLYVVCPTPSLSNQWVNLTAIYQNDTVHCFTNGAFAVSGTIMPATDNGLPLTFGGGAYGSTRSIDGQYDEIRLRGGTLSADRIKADYDMIKNRNFLIYAPVANGKGVAE